MKAAIVYRTDSEHERDVEGYLREFQHRTGKQLEIINPDSREGADFCRVYDIVQYPSIIALDDLGKVQNTWRGLPFPLIDEVSYYVQ